MNMNIQTSNSVSVVAMALRTTLANIHQDVSELPDKLAATPASIFAAMVYLL